VSRALARSGGAGDLFSVVAAPPINGNGQAVPAPSTAVDIAA
jgi:hypothetical protein